MRSLMLFALLPLTACSGDGGLLSGINLFTIQDDIALGQQLQAEIASSPQDYPILDEGQYADAYNHLYDIRDEILASGEVAHDQKFEWELHIIDDDETLNAFAAPGGYIYVYTGLMKFLDYEDELAGVMGHEIAHAANRHSTEQLTKAYGLSTLIGLALGNDPGLLTQVAASLVSLSFSRSDESEADDYSVYYLCETSYAADGAAGFFDKIQQAGGGEPPEFLSTHPSSSARVEAIEDLAAELGCDTTYGTTDEYQQIIDSLP